MNRFEEAKELVKANKNIETRAFDRSIDYKPWEEDLEPNKYMEYGYMTGQQELLEMMLEKSIINVFDLKKIWE